MMRGKKTRWVLILLTLILIAVIADVAVRLSVPRKSQLPSDCLVIPTKFLLDYPDCAQKLIKAANITNIHIIAPDTLETESDSRSPA